MTEWPTIFVPALWAWHEANFPALMDFAFSCWHEAIFLFVSYLHSGSGFWPFGSM